MIFEEFSESYLDTSKLLVYLSPRYLQFGTCNLLLIFGFSLNDSEYFMLSFAYYRLQYCDNISEVLEELPLYSNKLYMANTSLTSLALSNYVHYNSATQLVNVSNIWNITYYFCPAVAVVLAVFLVPLASIHASM